MDFFLLLSTVPVRILVDITRGFAIYSISVHPPVAPSTCLRTTSIHATPLPCSRLTTFYLLAATNCSNRSDSDWYEYRFATAACTSFFLHHTEMKSCFLSFFSCNPQCEAKAMQTMTRSVVFPWSFLVILIIFHPMGTLFPNNLSQKRRTIAGNSPFHAYVAPFAPNTTIEHPVSTQQQITTLSCASKPRQFIPDTSINENRPFQSMPQRFPFPPQFLTYHPRPRRSSPAKN